MKKPLTLAMILAFSLSITSCLKTRAQLRDDSSSPQDDRVVGKATPAPIQDPQGSYAIDEVKNELTRISGRLEDLERNQKQSTALSPVEKEAFGKLEARIVELEHAQADMLTAIKKIQENASPPDQKEVLDKARGLLQSGDKDGAIEALNAYLKNPKAKKTEEATFLRAEAFYSTKQYKKAIVDYSKFTDKFTHSTHVPQALYRIGLSFDALGMKEDAKGFYQELIEKYPKSTEAKKARSKIK